MNNQKNFKIARSKISFPLKNNKKFVSIRVLFVSSLFVVAIPMPEDMNPALYIFGWDV